LPSLHRPLAAAVWTDDQKSGRSAMSSANLTPIWKPLPAKLRAYEAVYWLNRSFQATLLSLERLEQLGIFRLEYLNEYKVRIEHTRAQVNEELIDTLHEQEMDDSARFDRMEREWENQRRDPDDVFFAARDRKQEIKEQIRELQKGLDRQRPRHATRKKRARK
jgi:hypothetical protein